jgi:FAD/FMN-containing dehydrogenase
VTRAGLRWLPLLPVPNGVSVGEMFALGWEGLRNWRDGNLLSHVRAVEWIAFDGRKFRTGLDAIKDGTPDVSGFLFGSRGKLGVITALDLDLLPLPAQQTSALLELPDAQTAYELLAELRGMEPNPETVIYWGETATQILREGNDYRVSEHTGVLLTVEWRDDEFVWPEAWNAYGKPLTGPQAIGGLWQDLLRFPRTVSRLYPECTGIRLCVPATALVELEMATQQLGRDANFPVAMWGNAEFGQMRVWVLQPDGEPRTTRKAEDLLRRITEAALSLDAGIAPGNQLPFDSKPAPSGDGTRPLEQLAAELQKRCDPHGMYAPLTA